MNVFNRLFFSHFRIDCLKEQQFGEFTNSYLSFFRLPERRKSV